MEKLDPFLARPIRQHHQDSGLREDIVQALHLVQNSQGNSRPIKFGGDYDDNNEEVVVKHEHHHYHHHTVNNNGHKFNSGNNGPQYNQPHIAFGGYNSPQFRNGDGSVQASSDEANINLELLEQNNVKKRKAVSETVEELSESSDKSSGFKFPQSRDIKLQRKRRSPDDDLNATPKKPEQIQSVRIYAPSMTYI